MGLVRCSGLLLLISAGIAFGTECSVENRRTNLTLCLEKTMINLFEPKLFWFGSDYGTPDSAQCPLGIASGMGCLNYNPALTSLGTRLLGSFNHTLLTKYLSIEFTAGPGQYTGCGNSFTENATVVNDIDPTSSTVVKPWYVRHTPNMTWDWTEGEYYSLYVYDVGYFVTHGVYINIQKNDIPTSGPNVIDKYHGPLITSPLHNPYAFVLYKQDGYLNPVAAEEWYNASHSSAFGTITRSHLIDFANLLNMTGPIAINWLVATGDEYASRIMYEQGFLVTCPVFIGQALDKKARPFLPNPSSLSVKMDVAFEGDKLEYTACCTDYTEPYVDFTLNPIGNELINSSGVRTNLTQTVSFEKMGFYGPHLNFTGDIYTMIAMDPDVPFSTAGTESRPLLHQMVINIMDGNFSTGEVVIPWNGPYPPNDEPHYYYFLLYKHMTPVNETIMLSYSDSSCNPGIAGRCLYDINSAVSDNGFKLVGATWFRSVRDSYVRYRKVLDNPSDLVAQCSGQPGFFDEDDHCRVSSAQMNRPHHVVSLVTGLFGCVFFSLFL